MVEGSVMKPDFILASDIHWRATKPSCRVDNYLYAQSRKFKYLLQEAQNCKADILIAGDLGNVPEWPNWLLTLFFELIAQTGFTQNMFVIPGQHDLPEHRLERWRESALGALNEALPQTVRVLTSPESSCVTKKGYLLVPCPYGIDPNEELALEKRLNYSVKDTILFMHRMIIQEPLWPGQVAQKANIFLRKFKDYGLILSGDNHQSFVSSTPSKSTPSGKRWLVNAGSMMRMKVDQFDHIPKFFLYSREGGVVEREFPHEPSEEVINLENSITEKERKARTKEFISKVEGQENVEFSFENNIRKLIDKGDVRQGVIDKVWKAIPQRG